MDSVSQLGGLPLTAGAEDDPEDGLERQPLHALERGHVPVPRAQLLPGELRNGRPEGAHALPVERRLDEPPLAQVLLAVEHEDRVRPGEGPEELPALPGRRDVWVEAKDVADRVRAREEHHRLVSPVGADRDRVAETLVHAPQEARGLHRPSDGLPGGGGARAGRQLHGPSLRRAAS